LFKKQIDQCRQNQGMIKKTQDKGKQKDNKKRKTTNEKKETR
jgi:hypothetical protein